MYSAAAGTLPYPAGVAVDAAGYVYIAAEGFKQVLQIMQDGSPGPRNVVADMLGDPVGVAVDGAGDVFIADAGNHQVFEVAPDGTRSTVLLTGLGGVSPARLPR